MNRVHGDLAARPGLKLFEVRNGGGMKEFRECSVTTSGLVLLELRLVCTGFGKFQQQDRGSSAF